MAAKQIGRLHRHKMDDWRATRAGQRNFGIGRPLALRETMEFRHETFDIGQRAAGTGGMRQP